jgi:hypothetical protein
MLQESKTHYSFFTEMWAITKFPVMKLQGTCVAHVRLILGAHRERTRYNFEVRIWAQNIPKLAHMPNEDRNLEKSHTIQYLRTTQTE